MKKSNRQQVINQQVLEKMGNGDEFITEIQQESKPSRIDSRRARSEQHEVRKRKDRRYFDDWDD